MSSLLWPQKAEWPLQGELLGIQVESLCRERGVTKGVVKEGRTRAGCAEVLLGPSREP